MEIKHGDIGLDDNNLLFKNGDLVASTDQAQIVGGLTQSYTGNFRRFPTLGSNLQDSLDGPLDQRDILSNVQNVLFLDGWRVDNISIGENNEDINVAVEQATKTTDNTISLI